MLLQQKQQKQKQKQQKGQSEARSKRAPIFESPKAKARLSKRRSKRGSTQEGFTAEKLRAGKTKKAETLAGSAFRVRYAREGARTATLRKSGYYQADHKLQNPPGSGFRKELEFRAHRVRT